jgi:microcystin-dependent protein
MGQPYVGEIRMFAGNFPPNGWMFCEGQTLPISENEVLFQLIGTTYGGDGEETFNLPNLASRVPIHMGTGPDGTTYQIGEQAGTESETLNTQQIPVHNHSLIASTAASTLSPANALLSVPTSTQQGVAVYNDAVAPSNALHPSTLQPTGGSQPHENTQPFLCINFIISLFGVFPSQT